MCFCVSVKIILNIYKNVKNYKDKLTKVKDDETGEYQYAFTYYRRKGDTRFTYSILYDEDLK